MLSRNLVTSAEETQKREKLLLLVNTNGVLQAYTEQPLMQIWHPAKQLY